MPKTRSHEKVPRNASEVLGEIQGNIGAVEIYAKHAVALCAELREKTRQKETVDLSKVWMYVDFILGQAGRSKACLYEVSANQSTA